MKDDNDEDKKMAAVADDDLQAEETTVDPDSEAEKEAREEVGAFLESAGLSHLASQFEGLSMTDTVILLQILQQQSLEGSNAPNFNKSEEECTELLK
ncbi:MAG: hypothetical protein SGARI_005903, partial [Bacillariaceae sp.]